MSLKTTALDLLTTKFQGIDEKVLSRIARGIAKTAENEDDVKAAVEDITIQGVIDAYTDSRVTEGSQKAVMTYEEKHGLKDGKKINADGDEGLSSGNGDEKNEDDIPKWAKALMSDIAVLKGDKIASTRKATIDKLLENAPEKVKNQIQREYKRANFKDDDDFKEWIDEITPDVNEASSAQQAQTTAVSAPKGGGGKSGGVVASGVQARIESRKAETVAPAIKGLPTSN